MQVDTLRTEVEVFRHLRGEYVQLLEFTSIRHRLPQANCFSVRTNPAQLGIPKDLGASPNRAKPTPLMWSISRLLNLRICDFQHDNS